MGKWIVLPRSFLGHPLRPRSSCLKKQRCCLETPNQNRNPTTITSFGHHFCSFWALPDSHNWTVIFCLSTIHQVIGRTAFFHDFKVTYIIPYFYPPDILRWEKESGPNSPMEFSWLKNGLQLGCPQVMDQHLNHNTRWILVVDHNNKVIIWAASDCSYVWLWFLKTDLLLLLTVQFLFILSTSSSSN